MMRFSRMERVRDREVTPRRVAAAERFLKKEIRKAGLFAEEVAAELPTPLERIQNHDEGSKEFWQGMRDYNAKRWRAERRKLAEYPAEERSRILAAWGSSRLPGDANYFGEFLKAWEANRAERTRPVDDRERAYLARLGDWLAALAFEPSERLFIHEMEKRGLVIRRANGNVIEFKAVPSC